MVIGQFSYETFRVQTTFPAQISLIPAMFSCNCMIAINYLNITLEKNIITDS